MTPRTRTHSEALSTQSSEASSLSLQCPGSSSSTSNTFESDVSPRPIQGALSCYWNQSDALVPVVPTMSNFGQTHNLPRAPLYLRNQFGNRDEKELFSTIDFEVSSYYLESVGLTNG